MEMVLLDRDGVLTEDRADSVKHPDELVLLPGAAEAVARLNRAGVRAVVVTNQSVIGRGIIDNAMLERIHDKLHAELAGAGAHLDAIIVCPDHPDRPTVRRKPGPGMLREALARFAAEPAEAPMVGDSLADLEAAAALGCPRVLVRTGKGAVTEAKGLPAHVLPVSVYDDLARAVDALLKARP
jgi:D-glycero-D-manno-heptose 1,7-bisphosphate phosphatase